MPAFFDDETPRGACNDYDDDGDDDENLPQIRQLSSSLLALSGANLSASLAQIHQEIKGEGGLSRSRSLINSAKNLELTGVKGSWRTNPLIQIVIMGLLFMFVFISFSTIQVFSGKLYGEQLGSNDNLVLYLVFAIGCFFSPSITTSLGCKLTMFLGICGYACMVVAGLIYFEGNPAKDNACCHGLQWIVIGGNALCGFGAAILWTAQGRMILEYTSDENRGFLFGIFWAFFQAAALIGGVLALVYFNQAGDDADLTPLYFVFLGCILAGGAGVFVLQEPEAIEDPLSPRTPAMSAVPVNSPLQDMWATCMMFCTPKMATLAVLFFYTGFNQPYQLITYGRYFNKSTLAIQQIVFYSTEIVGGLVFGMVLDQAAPNERRGRAVSSLAFLSVITLAGFALALPRELDHKGDVVCSDSVQTECLELIEPFKSDFWQPTGAMALWGLSDAMAQTYAYWLLGALYSEGTEKARAVGFYKLTQSLGWALGFALMPVDRVAPHIQLYLTAGSFIVGGLLSLMQLPPANPGSSDPKALLGKTDDE